jgi:hypothetical protein
MQNSTQQTVRELRREVLDIEQKLEKFPELYKDYKDNDMDTFFLNEMKEYLEERLREVHKVLYDMAIKKSA